MAWAEPTLARRQGSTGSAHRSQDIRGVDHLITGDKNLALADRYPIITPNGILEDAWGMQFSEWMVKRLFNLM
ncbi:MULTISPECIES: hypothetical protein [Acidithiobacillus]|uniref:hypothetical protein n=1 Tax=Acidithiobacillus TaxID=119977 RepID=UPI001D012835|nr:MULTISPECIES: hypothetical protein [Acidithiobacillus]